MLSFSSSHYSEIQSFLQESFAKIEKNQTLSEQAMRFLLQIHTFAKNKQFPQLLEINELLKLEHLELKKIAKKSVKKHEHTPARSNSFKSAVSFPGAPMSVSPPSPVIATDGFISENIAILGETSDISIFDEISEFNEKLSESAECVGASFPENDSMDVLPHLRATMEFGGGDTSSRWTIPEDDETSIDQLNSIEMMSATILIRLRERYVGE